MCQVHRVTSAVVQCWWLNGRGRGALLARVARKISHDQRRIIRARKYHVRKTRRKLRSLGITLTKIPRCQWDTS